MAQAPIEDETRQILSLLGGPEVFPPSVRDATGLAHALREGLPYAAYEALLRAIDLPSRDLSQLIGVAPRTLARRRERRQLLPVESDRLYRIAHVTSLAATVFGSLDEARAWLREENAALGGATPLSLLDTEIGTRQVEDVLHRIAHGIWS